MRVRSIVALTAIGLTAVVGSADPSRADLAVARATPAATLAIVNGTMIDGTGARPVRNAAVLIKGKRIVYAGPRRRVKIPPGARRIDVRGGTIMPGIINTHIHQANDEISLRAWLMGGVTTVRDLGAGSDTQWIFTHRNRVNRSSRRARLLAVGPFITVPEGYPKAIWGGSGLVVTSVEDARAKTEQVIAAGCDTVKIGLESGEIFGRAPLPMLSPEEAKAIVEVAHARGKRVSAHAMVTADFRRAIEAGVDEIAHYNVQDTPQELLDRMVAEKIVLVPTLELLQLVHATIYGDTLKRFVRAGGIVALGTDYMGAGPGYAYDLGMPWHELLYMVRAGMTPMQALVAATSNAAYTVGHPELGALKKGKIADVIAIEGNPLRDIELMEKVTLVVHNGVVAKNRAKSK